MVQTYVGVFVADCHNHSKVPEKYRGKGKAGAPFRTSSNWFLASTNPHNPLVDEWLVVYVNHLLTLPDLTMPYFLAHCALTQARMNNQTVDNIWASTMSRTKEAEMRRILNGPLSEKRACLNYPKENIYDCAFVKRPAIQRVLSGDYWRQIQMKLRLEAID